MRRAPTPAQATRARRVGAAVILVAAVVDLVSALTPPLRSRLDALSDAYPLAINSAAAVVAVLAGIALLQLSRGIRRGQRTAWLLGIIVLVISAAAHILKALDVEEAVFALAAAGYLSYQHACFQAPSDRESTRRGFATLAVVAVSIVVVATIAVQLSHDRMSWDSAFHAVLERFVGLNSVPLTGRFGQILGAVLIAAGIGLAASATWLVLRPVLHLGEHHEISVDEARAFVERHGGDTLSYFSLREDKHHAVYHDTLFAYAVHNGVCLLSPDPIGPPEQHTAAWTAFRADVSRQGWPLAVLGASEEWLPIYRASGMRERYIGDEAVVDVSSFSMEGGAMKGLRQAVNRIAKYGYTIEFYDPSTLDPALADKLRDLMTETRRGGVERGFSMTLSRVFEPGDKGLLLAVCFDPQGQPAAFCQYVPAPDIGGYSLDLMRRSAGEHPNGLTDFVVVRTIEHVRDLGGKAISLNFATMRAVLAGESGDTLSDKVQRAVLERLGDSMQIESLWKYNAKFKPTWRPRFLVYDAPENLMAVGLAMAAAEQWWELPVIGRFLGPRPDESKPPARPTTGVV